MVSASVNRTLYQSVDGQFVARWENARLQGYAATSAATIAGLRRCATICPHIGNIALPYPPVAPVVKASPTIWILSWNRKPIHLEKFFAV